MEKIINILLELIAYLCIFTCIGYKREGKLKLRDVIIIFILLSIGISIFKDVITINIVY